MRVLNALVILCVHSGILRAENVLTPPLKIQYPENGTLKEAEDGGPSPENCIKSLIHNKATILRRLNRITVKDAATALLLNNAEALSTTIKENPEDRRKILARLLYDDEHVELLSANETETLASAFRAHPDHIRMKITALLKENRLLTKKLDDIAIYLADFLALKSDEELEEKPASIEHEIKRLLYSGPEKLRETVEAYGLKYGRSMEVNTPTNPDNDDKRGHRTNAGCGMPVLNRTIFEINIDEEENNRISQVDKNAPDVQTTKDEDVQDKSDGLTDISETYVGGLQFLDVPRGEDMRIHNLKMDEESLLYGTVSNLMSFLQPGEFPLGLVKEALHGHVSFHILVLQILKLEGLVLSWILFWAVLSLCLPFAVIAHMCCPRKNMQRLRDDSSSASSLLNNKCTMKTVEITLYILLILFFCCILLMLMSNDKVSRATEKLPTAASTAFKDAETFVKNTQMQISFVATTSFDLAVDVIEKDLNDIQRLLGAPLQRDLVRETGINNTKMSLKDLRLSGVEISRRVQELLKESAAAETSGKLLQTSLTELAEQLQQTRKFCIQKDRALCESVHGVGLNVVFSTEELLTDTNLIYLERISQDKDLDNVVDETLTAFDDIPQHVSVETSSQRTEVREALRKRRKNIHNSVRCAEEISRSITDALSSIAVDVSRMLEEVVSGDLWRYLMAVGIVLWLFTIWTLNLCGSPCRYHYSRKTVLSLTIGIFFSCTITMVLWAFGSAYFIIGGHGQTLVCNPLYEEHFKVLSSILDEDGLLYEEGFFRHVFKGNESIRIENVLRNCQRNQPSFTTFHLQNHIDVNAISNYQSWSDLQEILERFSFNTDTFKIPSADRMERHLQEYANASRVKFKTFRSNLMRPIIHKDLNTFLEQLYAVTAQITNTRSATSFEKLMFKTRDIVNRELRTVQYHRDSLLYKLTALEILLQPLTVQCEVNIMQLREAQAVVDEQADFLVEKNIKNYIFRFQKHLDELQKYTNDQIRKKIGKCKPIWDVFFYARHHVCKSLVDPVNGLSFFHFLTISVLICLAPIVIITLMRDREREEDLFNTLLARGDQHGMGAIWTSQLERSSSEDVNAVAPTNAEVGWISPRPTSESVVPSPPRPPTEPKISPPRLSSESVSRRSSSPRNQQVFAIAKAKAARGRYDALKLIERTWKMPRSPKHWL